MSSFSGQQISSALLKKGFVKDGGDDHHWYRLEYKGKKQFIRTKVSHSKKTEYSYKGLLRFIQKQIHLEMNDCIEYIKCNLSEEDYFKILDSKGLLK